MTTGLSYLSAPQREWLAGLYADPALRALARAARGRRARVWVVGGALRDSLLGRTWHDLDLVTDADAQHVRELLRAAGGFGQVAGPRHATVRGALPAGGTRVRVDITPLDRDPLGGLDLDGDLARRDMTVNAMALDLVTGALHDPCGGLVALKAGELDTPRDPAESLGADPIRLVRALRMEAALELRCSERVDVYLRSSRDLLATLAPDRLFAEVLRCDVPGAATLARLAAGATSRGLGDLILPFTATAGPFVRAGAPLDEVLGEMVAGARDPFTLLVSRGVPRKRARSLLAAYAARAG